MASYLKSVVKLAQMSKNKPNENQQRLSYLEPLLDSKKVGSLFQANFSLSPLASVPRLIAGHFSRVLEKRDVLFKNVSLNKKEEIHFFRKQKQKMCFFSHPIL